MTVIKIYILIVSIFFCATCIDDNYIKLFPKQGTEDKIFLEFSILKENIADDTEVLIRRFCLGDNINDLERNCEIDPIIKNFTISPKNPLRLQVPLHKKAIAKVLFQYISLLKSAEAAVYFDESHKVYSSKNCVLSGVSVEGFPKFLCKGLVENTKQVQNIQFRFFGNEELKKSGSGGGLIDKIILGPTFVPAEVILKFSSTLK
ncbi:hypothetical protein [Leptospira haakeii]|uniref:Lipoprotein n=1 Tax=Leptospira haakeii TaxID=2023198 RepID=A0ABX4PKK1_9LEPT|nr:hypothetical protein [Leptospira haakeii]PKA15871.1 hypothetical protein CH363_10150 [Leptospira haakeii]PKA19391.1 hypothetical protein CH377_12325 [Leptospira haakeii]